MGGKIYAEPHACELCKELILIGQNELSEIWRDGRVSRYHLSCFDSIVKSDLLETEDIRLDFHNAITNDLSVLDTEDIE